MSIAAHQQRFLALMEQFAQGRTDADTFCGEFVPLWIAERDAVLAKKAVWPQPYDEMLLSAWQRGELTVAEFQEQWATLWGNGQHEQFQRTVNAVHSACMAYSPEPEHPADLDAEQLRQLVRQALAALYVPAASAV